MADDIEGARSGGARIPTVIADDVHVVYRVNGGGTAGRGSATAALNRILRRDKGRAAACAGSTPCAGSPSSRTGARPSA